MALCKVMIIGNLGSDPEMRYTPNNRAVTQFNVAVNQSTKNQSTKNQAMHAGTHGGGHPSETLAYLCLHERKIPG